MSYIRFALMIATSTVVMFGLMYLNTYTWEHVFFSETRGYMAILMGATMAIVMLAYMLGMYANRALNIAIFAGAALVFAGSLWLVRSQATVSGPSYMRAMIPHHSIAVMTSERAGIEDARVRKLADEIIAAQRREIAEMRYLVAHVAAGDVVDEVYQDPPAEVGTVAAAVDRVLLAGLDPSPLSEDEAAQVLSAEASCSFSRSPEADPILWASPEGSAAVKLNGVLIALQGEDGDWTAPGLSVAVAGLGEAASWRSNAEMVFALNEGPTIGYRGFSDCAV